MNISSNNSIKIAHFRSLGRRYRGAPYAGRYAQQGMNNA